MAFLCRAPVRRAGPACPASVRAVLALLLLAPGPARALTSPALVFQPSSATGPAWGTERKLFRLSNGPKSLVALYAGNNQLHLGVSNNNGSTWTDSLLQSGPVASVTAYTFSAALDPATNNLHVVFGTGPVGWSSNIGYAVASYAAVPADPTFTLTVTMNAVGNPAGNHYEFPSAAIATAGGVPYLHVVLGEKECCAGVENRVRWNMRRATAAVGGWLLGSPGRDLTIAMATGGKTQVGNNPGPIPCVLADEANRLWTSWWDANGHFYIRNVNLTGTVWTEAAVQYAKFTVGASGKKALGNAPVSGAVHSAALRPGGGQVAFVFPAAVSRTPTTHQLLINNTTATAWNGPGSTRVTVTGLNVNAAGNGFPSLTADASGAYYAFMTDSATRSRGSIVFYRYPAGGPLSPKTILWDDPLNRGNRHASAGLDTSVDIGVLWSQSQTGNPGIAIRYFNILAAPLQAGVTVSASELCQGAPLTVTLTVTNMGNLAVLSATPFLSVRPAGGDSVTLAVVSVPATASIAPGASAAFVWTLSATGFLPRVTGQGYVSLTASVTGLYASAVTRAGGTAPAVGVHAPPALVPALSVSATTLSTGSTLVVTLTVTNTGTVGVTAVAPSLGARAAGGGAVVLTPVSGPTPASADVAPGGAVAFGWQYTVASVGGAGSGLVVFSATAAGTGVLCGNAASATLVSAPALVQRAAHLDGSVIAAGPDPVCLGSVVTVLESVTNTGVAAAWVTPSVSLYVEGTGTAALVSSPPAPVWLAGGASVLVGWAYRTTGGGTLRFTATCVGVDANSGAVLTTGPNTAGQVTSTAPGGVVAAASAPAAASVGQWFAVTLTVTNTGGTTTGSGSPSIAVTAGAANVAPAAGPSPAGPVSLAPGASQTFVWTYSASGTGVTTFAPTTSVLGCGTTVMTAVVRPAALSAVLAAFPTPRDTGQAFLATLTIMNTGDARALGVNAAGFRVTGTGNAALSAGPSPSLPVDIIGGAAATFTWTYTGVAPGLVTLSTTVAGMDENSSLTVSAGPVASAAVLLQAPVALAAALAAPSAAVCLGRQFVVTLTVTNTGGADALALAPAAVRLTGTGAASLVAGPAPSGTVALAGGATVTFTWTYAGTAAGNVTFSTTAAGTDANGGWPVASNPAASAAVTVTPGAILVAAASAPGLVSRGQWFPVALTVSNTGTAVATAVAPAIAASPGGALVVLKAGPAPPGPVSLAAGGSTTFVWTWSAAGSGSIGFTVTGTGSDACGTIAASASVAVAAQAPAALAVSVAFSQNPINNGQDVDVTVTITNTGDATALGVDMSASLLAGSASVDFTGGPSPDLPIDIPGGAAVTIAWTYNATSVGSLRYSITVAGTDENSGRTVRAASGPSAPLVVQAPASLAAAAAVSPLSVCQGRAVLVTVTITNTGGADATLVDADPFAASGSGDAAYADGPNPALPADIPGGTAITVTWTFTGESIGTMTLTTTVTGMDFNDGTDLAVGPVPSKVLTVTAGAFLAGTLSAPAVVSVGQWFPVALTVTNSGMASITGTNPAIAAGPGASLVAAKGSAVPAGPLTVLAAGATTFVWTYSASGAGAAVFTATAAGSDTCGAVQAAAGGGVVVQTPAALAARAVAFPSPRNPGQTFLVTVTVTNSGQADAVGLNAAAFAVSGSGGATALAGPSPAMPVPLAGGTSITFTWTFTGASPGQVVLSTTVTGQDANAGWMVTTGTVAANPEWIQAPASLHAAAAVLASTICTGRTFLVTLTVTNAGEAGATGVTAIPFLQAGTGGSAVVVQAPSLPVSLAGGASVTLTWTLAGGAVGNVDFTTTVTGTDFNDGTALATGPVPSGVLAVLGGAVVGGVLSVAPTVSVGQWFPVALTVTNGGTGDATGTTPGIAAGPGASLVAAQGTPVPAGPLAILAGGATTFVWTYSASGAGAAVFTATVTGSDACGAVQAAAGGGVVVQTPAALTARAVAFPGPRNPGQTFLVTVTVTNTGQAAALGVAPATPLASGTGTVGVPAGPFPAAPVPLAGGAAATFTWTFTGNSAGQVVLSTTVTGQDANAGWTVTTGPVAANPEWIQVPASLYAAFAVLASTICTGRTFLVTLTVTNAGEAGATGVTAAAFAQAGTGGGASVVQAPSLPVSLAGGASVTLTWTLAGGAVGDVAFTTTVTGADGNDGTALAAGPATTGSLTVNPGSALATSLAAPASVTAGQYFTISLTVTNAGSAPAASFVPGLAAGPGAVTAVGGPVPVDLASLAVGSATTFTWTWSASGSGPVTFTGTVTAADLCGTIAGTATRALAVQTPPLLRAGISCSPSPGNTGRAFVVTLTVTNVGQATAASLTGAALRADGSGAASLTAGPTPAFPAALAGGATVSFSWTFTASSPGSVTLSTTLTASDANTGAAVGPLPVAGSPYVISPPAALVSSASVSPPAASVGQWVTVAFTVTNAGGGTATGVTPAVVNGSAATLGAISGPVPPGPVTLAPGAAATFAWTYSLSGAGSLGFSLTAVGADAWTGGPLFTTRTVAGQALSHAALTAGLAVSATGLGTGQSLLVTLTVTNTGGTAATGLLPPPLAILGGAVIVTASPPAVPVSLAGGTGLTWSWTLTAVAQGSASFAATVTGTDSGSGLPVSALVAVSTPVVVEVLGLAVVTFTASPATVPLGGTIIVAMTVSNSGTMPAAFVSPGALVVLGTGQAAVVSGPVPASVVSLAPGSATTFTWTWKALRGNEVRFSGRATGVAVASADSVTGTVEIPEAGTTIDSLVVYPNPFEPAKAPGGAVRFRFMPAFSTVRIFTIAGEPVRDLTAGPEGMAEWDGRNDGGSPVLTGVYVYVARAPKGGRKIGQVRVWR